MSLNSMYIIIGLVSVFLLGLMNYKSLSPEKEFSSIILADKIKLSAVKRIVSVDIKSTGCFGSEKENLTLYKKDSVYLLQQILNNENKVVPVSALQKDSLMSFIAWINKLDDKGMCTTSHHYVVKTKSKTVRKTDWNCQTEKILSLREFLNLQKPV